MAYLCHSPPFFWSLCILGGINITHDGDGRELFPRIPLAKGLVTIDAVGSTLPSPEKMKMIEREREYFWILHLQHKYCGKTPASLTSLNGEQPILTNAYIDNDVISNTQLPAFPTNSEDGLDHLHPTSNKIGQIHLLHIAEAS